ncbi:MAG: hypothetical protein AAF721_19060 [Myxococcota bacterium]
MSDDEKPGSNEPNEDDAATSDAQAEPEAEADAEPKADAEPEPKPEADAEPKPKADAEPEAKADAEPEAKAEPEPKAKADAEPKPKPEVGAEPTPKPKAKADVEPKPKPESKAEAEPKRESDAEPKPDPSANADSEPGPDPYTKSSPEKPAPPVARKPIPRGWRLAVQLLLPPLLCAGAIGIHWWLNVPDNIEISPRDQGAKKRKKKRKKPRKRKRKPKEARSKPRSEDALARAWKRWSKRDIDDEPVVVTWGRRHQALIRKAFFQARTEAFEGAPEEPVVTLAASKCHTIRCRFVLRSEFAHENDAISDSLSRLHSGDDSLWRHYAAERVDPPEGEPPGSDYVEVTVAFAADDIDPSTMLVVAADKPAAGSAGEPQAARGSGGAPVEG